jgi:hypothetical protein
MAEYKTYYDMIMELPIVKDLIKENKKLTKQNEKLKYKNKALKSILYELSNNFGQKQKLTKLRNNKLIHHPLVKVKQEPFDEPTLCDTLADDNDSVVLINKVKENIIYDLEEDDNIDLNNGFDDNDEKAQNIIKDLKNELNLEEVEAEEEVEEEVEAEDAEEEEVEEEVEEEEVEEEEVEEEEVEEEEVEEEAEEEVEEEEAEEEVEEVTIKGKSYYTSNKINGIIYEITKDEDIGDEVGIFKEGKPVFHKK